VILASEPLTAIGLKGIGVTGFEPAASSSRTKRATKLRYTPVTDFQRLTSLCALVEISLSTRMVPQKGFREDREVR